MTHRAMPQETKYLFASYARADADVVHPFVNVLREELRSRAPEIDVWIDTEALQPGQQWHREIERILRKSVGLLVFVSRHSVGSEWVERELRATLQAGDRLIIPVILEDATTLELPDELRVRQWVDLSQRRDPAQVRRAAEVVAETAAAAVSGKRVRAPVPAAEAPALAARIAEQVRGATPAGEAEAAPPDSVFVVYGHDEQTLGEVEAYLNEVGVKTVVLSRIEGAEQSLLQKFFKFSAEARFAIVILSADDYGASRLQFEADGVGERALQFRARQNVILELGFFYGRLGWENVFVVYRKPDRPFPNFERPSDLDGVLFDAIDEKGKWRKSLRDRLTAARFKLRPGD